MANLNAFSGYLVWYKIIQTNPLFWYSIYMVILQERSFRSFQCLSSFSFGKLTLPILLRTIRKGSIKYHVGQRVKGDLEIKKMFIKCNKNAFSSNLKIDKLILNTNSTVFHLFYLFFSQNTTNCSMMLKLDWNYWFVSMYVSEKLLKLLNSTQWIVGLGFLYLQNIFLHGI